MTIWDDYGITLDEYAKMFNQYQEQVFQAYLRDKAYMVSSDGEQVSKVINIEVS